MRSIINAGRKLWLKFRRSDNISRERLSNANFEDNEPAADNDFLSGGLQFNNWVENKNSGLRRFTKIPGGIRCDILEPADNTWHNRIYSDVLNSSLTENQTYRFTAEVRCSVDGNFNASIEATNGDDAQPHPDVQTAVTNSEFSLVNTTFNYIPDSDGENGVSNVLVHLYPNIALSAGGFYEVRNVSLKEISQFELDASSESNDAKLFTGKALSFDGTNDYVELPADLDETVWTCAMWLGDYVNPNSYDWLFGKDTARSIGLANNPTDKIFFRSSSSTYYDFTTDTPSSYTGYKRFVFASDGTDISLYIDGVFMDSVTPDDTHLRLRRIMAGYNTSSHLTEGKASDFQFYDSCWTANDAYLDYTYPNELLIDAGGSVARNSLRVHLPMSEGSGAVAFNSVRLGEELIENNDFSSVGNWNAGGGWEVLGNDKATNDGTGGILRQFDTVPLNTRFKVVFTVADYVTGNIQIKFAPVGQSVAITGNNTYTVYTAGDNNSNDDFQIIATSGFVGSITNISVREIVTPFDSIYNGAALGATWVTAQPTIPQLGMQDWSKGSNLFPTSESSLTLSNVTSSAVEGPAINSADALNTATRLTETTADDQHYSSAVFVAYSGIEYTFSVFVKKGTYDEIRLVTSSNRIVSSVYFTFSTESFRATTYSPAAEDYGNGWYRVSWTATAKTDFGASSSCVLYLSPLDLSSYAGATSKYTDFFGWQVEIGDTMGNYIPTNGLLAQDATLTANPYNAGYDVVGNALRTRNKGLNLDGIGYAEIVADSSLTDITNGTIQFWLKNTNTVKFVVFSEEGGTDYIGAYNPPTASGLWYNSSSTGTITSTADNNIALTTGMITDGDWHMHTMTGVNISSFTVFQLGNYSNTFPLDTIINDVRLYNRVLTAAEIINNYKVGKSKHS